MQIYTSTLGCSLFGRQLNYDELRFVFVTTLIADLGQVLAAVVEEVMGGPEPATRQPEQSNTLLPVKKAPGRR
jgi:hypothetical protein